MDNTKILKQKLKGKLQKAKGEIQNSFSAEDDLGMKFKGGLSRVKGETNEAIADIKQKAKNNFEKSKKDEKDELKSY